MQRLILLMILCLSGCASRPDDKVLRYLNLAVALGERDPDAIDYYYGPEEWVSSTRAHPPSLAEIQHAALELERGIENNNFLALQLKAIAVRAELLQGKRHSFDEEARAFFDLEVPVLRDSPELERVRQEIAALLSGSTYADFDTRFMIPSERLQIVMERAIQGCRERTLQHMKLPSGEFVSLAFVSDKPWNAYSSYEGQFHSLVRINADFPLTVDRALQLACHEAYPGHHAYNTLVDAQLVQREHRFDLMVQPTFSPQSFTSEAMATIATDLGFPGEDRLRFERDVLFPAAGISTENAELHIRVNRLLDQLASSEAEVARDFLDGNLEWTRAASALEDKALMLHSDATLKYLNEYRSYMLTYTVGQEMARRCLSGRGEADPWAFYEQLVLGRVSIKECGYTHEDSLDKNWR